MGYTEKIVIIGAGISGLACAYRLRQLGMPCVVLEATDRAGGVIATIRRDGFLFETGPQCPRFPASVWRLLRELRLEGEFVAGDPNAKRYILRSGRLHRAPFSPTGMIATGLVGLRSKWRILTEVLRSSQAPEYEESLADFVQRKFGAEVLDYLVDPIISTVYFGDAQQMGMESAFPALVQWERDYGSLARGAVRARNAKPRATEQKELTAEPRRSAKGRGLVVTDALPSLGSFRQGMAVLPEKLADDLGGRIRYRSGVTCVAPLATKDGKSEEGWQICLAGGEITTEHLILAVPAYIAAQALENSVPELASRLQAIEYAPLCAVASAYERGKVANALDGFGLMVPRREELHTICTFWNSSLFPERAPQGKVLLTTLARSGANHDGLVMSGEQCAQTVETETGRNLGITGEPLDQVVWKDERALPQYNVGHAQRVAEIESILRTVPGLHLAGNFLKGRSLGDCVELAYRVAEDVHGCV